MTEKQEFTLKTHENRRYFAMNTKGLDYTLLTLVIIGAVNWGLIGSPQQAAGPKGQMKSLRTQRRWRPWVYQHRLGKPFH